MTSLDGLLILVGAIVIIACALDGLLRSVVMLASFYLIATAIGMLTMATEMLRGIAVALVSVIGGRVPSLVITQTIIFVVLTVPLFVGFYFISKVLFRDTTLPKLQILDNILGAIVGIVLALLIMALIYNTWGVAVSARWYNVQTWQSMRTAYLGSFLRLYMREALVTYRSLFFMFDFLDYPPFFLLQA